MSLSIDDQQQTHTTTEPGPTTTELSPTTTEAAPTTTEPTPTGPIQPKQQNLILHKKYENYHKQVVYYSQNKVFYLY